MAPIPNPRVIYAKLPGEGYPVPGQDVVFEDATSIDLESVTLDGGLLVKTLYLSLDPYMRNMMRDPKIPSYSPPFPLGEAMYGRGVGLVLRSESSKYQKGDFVFGFLKWHKYNVLRDSEVQEKIVTSAHIPLTAYLSVAGGTARTAFYSTRKYADWKAGETIFVSTAAGAVGSVVCQLAKLAGLRVIGSTGDDGKVEWLQKELELDIVFNYKKKNYFDALKESGGIDIYFDNVGGEALDAALLYAKNNARIICCGYASEYNKAKGSYGLKHASQILVKSLHVNGFIVSNLVAEVGPEPFEKEYLSLVRAGKLKYTEDITEGLENLPEAFVALLKGENKGKAIVKVSNESE